MRLKLGNRLGSGAYGTVYEAVNNDNEHVAVKIIDIDQQSGIPFLLEPTIMSTIDHIYLNSAIKVYSTADKLYIVQGLATNDARNFVHKSSPPTINTLRRWSFSLAQAVKCLHDNDIIHADIKGTNVLLYKDQSVKLTDFTLATLSQWDHNYVAYTSTHRAPEVWLRRLWDKPADIWSLGCTFYELAYGYDLFTHQQCDNNNDEVDANINMFIDWATLNGEDFKIKRRCVTYRPYTLTSSFVNADNDYHLLNDLIRKMLIINPKNRLTIDDVVDHEFFMDMTIVPYRMLHIQGQKLNQKHLEMFDKLSPDFNECVIEYAKQLYAKIVNMPAICNKAKLETCLWIAHKQICNSIPPITQNIKNMIMYENLICNYLAFKLLPIS